MLRNALRSPGTSILVPAGPLYLQFSGSKVNPKPSTLLVHFVRTQKGALKKTLNPLPLNPTIPFRALFGFRN